MIINKYRKITGGWGVSIPPAVMERIGVKPGDRVCILTAPGMIVLKKAATLVKALGDAKRIRYITGERS